MNRAERKEQNISTVRTDTLTTNKLYPLATNEVRAVRAVVKRTHTHEPIQLHNILSILQYRNVTW